MKKNCGQVGYLQRLYRDARLTEHTILQSHLRSSFPSGSILQVSPKKALYTHRTAYLDQIDRFRS